MLSRPFKTAGVYLILFFNFTAAAGAINWRDRVLPLPQEMEIAGSVGARAGEVSYGLPAGEDSAAFRTIRELFGGFAKGGEGGAGEVNISFVLTGGETGTVPVKILSRLGDLPNSGQAYSITYRQGERTEIIIAANTPTGLLYGAHTLTQLVKPGVGVDAGTVLRIPLAEITDWPDIEQRGQWASSGYPEWGWHSRWKMNMHKVLVNSRFVTEDELPVFSLCCLVGEVGERFFNWADGIGYTPIPYIGHLGHRSNRDWSHLSPPVYTDGHPAPAYRGFCWSDGGIYEVLTDHMRRMAEASIESPEGRRDIQVWLTELGDISCYCEGCGGENGYILETKGLIRVYEEVRKEYPDVRLRITLSQGSRPVNDRILELIKPHGIGVEYYDGALTYRTDRGEMIFPELEEYARGGGLVDVIPIATPCFHALYPASLPHYIKFRAGEFADKKLQAVTLYSQGSTYYPLNMAAWAEYMWNSGGRSPRDFARAYAAIEGIAEPELFARWADAAGEAAWELAVSRYNNAFAYGRYSWVPGVIGDEEPQRLNTVRLGRGLRYAREALELAREAGDRDMLIESENTLAALKSIELRSEIASLSRSAENRKEAARRLDMLDVCARLINANIYEWHGSAMERRAAFAEGPAYINPPSLWGISPATDLGWRREMQAHGLLRASDVERQMAQFMGIPDTRGEAAPVEIAEWTADDFSGGTAKLAVEISGIISSGGGLYNLGLNILEGDGCIPRTIRLVAEDSPGGDRRVISSRRGRTRPTLRPAEASTSAYDHLLRVPGRAEGGLFLEVELAEGGRGSAGYITLRRVAARDEFSQEKIDLLRK